MENHNMLNRFSRELQFLPRREDCVRIYTDGSCWPNPKGRGGYAYKAIYQDTLNEFTEQGCEPVSTNNRAEMLAVILALGDLGNLRHTVELVTDSEYVAYGITKWRFGWKARNFKGIKNEDLWKQLDSLLERHDVYVTWVRGHSDCDENNEVDQLAEDARLNYNTRMK
jgi:ribonuclease HI